jgi:hypothetical protein
MVLWATPQPIAFNANFVPASERYRDFFDPILQTYRVPRLNVAARLVASVYGSGDDRPGSFFVMLLLQHSYVVIAT